MSAHNLPSPRRCPICYEILDPLGIVRLERGGYISEYELAFPEMAWDVGYLTHLYFHPHLIKPTKAEWTLKAKGEEAESRWRRRSQDGGGIGRGDQFLSYKFIERTTER